MRNMKKMKHSNGLISAVQAEFGYWVGVSSSSSEHLKGRLKIVF